MVKKSRNQKPTSKFLKWLFRISASVIITLILGVFALWAYETLTSPIQVSAYYQEDLESNSTYYQINIENTDFKRIRDFDFEIVKNCSYIITPLESELPESCELTSRLWKGGCDDFKSGENIEINFKVFPVTNCSFRLKYSRDYLSYFFQTITKNISSYKMSTLVPSNKKCDQNSSLHVRVFPINNTVYVGGIALVVTELSSCDIQNITATGEWFNSSIFTVDSLLTDNPYSNKYLILPNTKIQVYNWFNVVPKTQFLGLNVIVESDSGIRKIPVVLNVTNSPVAYKDISYYDSLTEYNDSVTEMVINHLLKSGNLSSEYEISKSIFNFVKSTISLPEKLSDTKYYDGNDVSSLKILNSSPVIGTETEYNRLFAMFLKSVGIPAKNIWINNSMYTEIFINNVSQTINPFVATNFNLNYSS